MLEHRNAAEPQSKPEQKNVVAVINRAAGGGTGNTSASTRDRLARIFAAAGLDPEIHIVPPSLLAAALQKTARSEAEVVVIGGGDGSVNTAVKYLHTTDKILGVLPLGSMNHFAHSLGIPDVLEDAVRILSCGHLKNIDIGEVNGHTFVNNASIGIYPEAVRLRERYRERWGLRKHVAMGYALFLLMLNLPVVDLVLEKGAERERITAPFVFVGNNRYEPKFLSYTERESLSQGCLGVYYADDIDVRRLVGIALKVLMGRQRHALELERVETMELTVDSRRRRLKIALDGEVRHMTTPLRFRILPRSLKVLSAQEES